MFASGDCNLKSLRSELKSPRSQVAAKPTIDTEIKAKRNNIISELIVFSATKAKAKVKFGVRYLCGPQCEKSAVPININTKAKAKKYFWGINFTLISVSTVLRTENAVDNAERVLPLRTQNLALSFSTPNALSEI